MRFAFVLLLALAGCHYNDPPAATPADVPPLPPASGTPIGYLIDSASDLKLRDDQLKQLQELDSSLAAQDADIDVQLRQIEKPEEEEQQTPQEAKAHTKKIRYNNAPGASVKTNADAGKLHEMRADNDKQALGKAWVLLDKDQQQSAKKILEDRGIEVPGAQKTAPKPSENGTPVPGLEP
jgi:hypothetical protein